MLEFVAVSKYANLYLSLSDNNLKEKAMNAINKCKEKAGHCIDALHTLLMHAKLRNCLFVPETRQATAGLERYQGDDGHQCMTLLLYVLSHTTVIQ